MTTKLLIVESPGKIKTLSRILGKDWILEASIGHVTELAQDGPKRLGFEIQGGKIETRYIPKKPSGHQVLSRLRKAIKRADEIYLATDPDREGEAIAWHLVQQLRLKKYVRVSYTQITDQAVKAAVKNPRALNLALVGAQRARQCLDKWVGYEVSPLLWNSSGGKSAGRVQSATLHLICERERERNTFKPIHYWTLHSHYREGFQARFEPRSTMSSEQALPEMTLHKNAASTADVTAPRILSEEEAKRIEREATTHSHFIKSIQNREERRNPPPPLITSSLQQASGMRFRYSPKKTMSIAQELYEGVNGKGLITYMRTDAVVLSLEFVGEARSWLKDHEPGVLPEKVPHFKMKADAQGAHEAIRPTDVTLTPEKARSFLNRDQQNIYALIWQRAVASQCQACVLARTQVEVVSGNTHWVSQGMRVIEPGYLKFWKNIEEEIKLPALSVGQRLTLEKVETGKKTTEPPSRYSEPKLVQLMEKLGIGRPSTYASTIETLKERDYVILEKNTLAPTSLGLQTDEVLKKAMPDLTCAQFTAKMEESLDQIAQGNLSWERFLCHWNESYFSPALIQAKAVLKNIPRNLTSNHFISNQPKLKKKNRTGKGSFKMRKFSKSTQRKTAR